MFFLGRLLGSAVELTLLRVSPEDVGGSACAETPGWLIFLNDKAGLIANGLSPSRTSRACYAPSTIQELTNCTGAQGSPRPAVRVTQGRAKHADARADPSCECPSNDPDHGVHEAR